MRAQLSYNERLADRLKYFVGDGAAPPVGLSPADAETWLELVRESVHVATRHHDALEALLAPRA